MVHRPQRAQFVRGVEPSEPRLGSGRQRRGLPLRAAIQFVKPKAGVGQRVRPGIEPAQVQRQERHNRRGGVTPLPLRCRLRDAAGGQQRQAQRHDEPAVHGSAHTVQARQDGTDAI